MLYPIRITALAKATAATALLAIVAAGCADQLTALQPDGAALLAKGGNGNPSPTASMHQPMIYTADLEPLNSSGVTGTARFMFAGGKFKARVHAKGLVPDMVHPQHIHFLPQCPPPSAAGADGLLTIADGKPFYGEVFIPLDFDIVPITGGSEFPTANPAGVLNYNERAGPEALVAAVDALYPGDQMLDSIDLQAARSSSTARS